MRAHLTGGGTQTITTYPTGTPGLVVHAAIQPCGDDTCWVVSHARTGMALSVCFGSPEGALAFAERIAVYTDWQITGDQLAATLKGLLSAIRAAGLESGGRQHAMSARSGIPFIDNGVIA